MSEAPIVRVQRVMPAPPSVVFDEWLDPEAMKEWMGPRPVRCVDITIETRDALHTQDILAALTAAGFPPRTN